MRRQEFGKHLATIWQAFVEIFSRYLCIVSRLFPGTAGGDTMWVEYEPTGAVGCARSRAPYQVGPDRGVPDIFLK